MNRHWLLPILFLTTVSGRGLGAVRSPMSLPGAGDQVGQPSAGIPANWQLSATDHFDIAYAPALTPQLARIRGDAERAYEQLSSTLRHELSLRPLLVLFSSRRELEVAIASGTVPGNREHILMPLDAPAARIRGDLVHELTHMFVFDIVPSSTRNDFPSWMHEGVAEAQRGEWGEDDLIVVREMLRTNTVPTLRNPAGADRRSLGGGWSGGSSRIFGHAAFDFLGSRGGQEAWRRFLVSLRDSAANPTDTYLATIGLSAEDFDRRFGEYLKARFRF